MLEAVQLRKSPKHGRTQVTKRCAHACPGMHWQCSAVHSSDVMGISVVQCRKAPLSFSKIWVHCTFPSRHHPYTIASQSRVYQSGSTAFKTFFWRCMTVPDGSFQPSPGRSGQVGGCQDFPSLGGKKMKYGVTPEILHRRFRTAAHMFAAAVFHQLEHAAARLQQTIYTGDTMSRTKPKTPLLTCLTHSWPA